MEEQEQSSVLRQAVLYLYSFSEQSLSRRIIVYSSTIVSIIIVSTGLGWALLTLIGKTTPMIVWTVVGGALLVTPAAILKIAQTRLERAELDAVSSINPNKVEGIEEGEASTGSESSGPGFEGEGIDDREYN